MLVRSDGPPVRPLLARHATPEAAPKPAKLTLWGEEAKSSPSLRTDCPLLAILVIQNCSAYVVVALALVQICDSARMMTFAQHE